MAKQKIKNAFLQIKIKSDLKERVKEVAAKRGKTLTDLITEFLEQECNGTLTQTA